MASRHGPRDRGAEGPAQEPQTGQAGGPAAGAGLFEAPAEGPHLSFLLVRLEGEELRKPSHSRWRPVTPLEFAPTRFLGTVRLQTAENYAALLPPDLPETFTARELSKALALPAGESSAAANVLAFMEAIRRTGTKGRSYLYTK